MLPQNEETVLAFLAVQTQWRYGASGYRTGLDYAGCKAALKAAGMRFKRVFRGLQLMEFEVLNLQANK